MTRNPSFAKDQASAASASSPSAQLQAGVSVIICCYNSVGRIEPTLRHLSRQTLVEGVPVEVIIVDNASTDSLVDTVLPAWDRLGAPFPLRLVQQPQPGLAFARMTGVLAARYAYGVFCDDDNWLAPDYLQRVVETLDTHPTVGAVGGGSVPALETEAPTWFYRHCASYAVGAQADSAGDVTHRCYLWGAGLGFRMRVLKAVYASGREPLVVDRQGSNLTSGGDGEICCWFIFAGYRLWYDDRLTFVHFIPAGRLTAAYFERMRAGFRASGFGTYRSYVIWKYGLFDDPSRHRHAGLVYLKAKVRALLSLLTAGASVARVREFERLCRSAG